MKKIIILICVGAILISSYKEQVKKNDASIGEGKRCTVETINNKNIYAWPKDGNVKRLIT